MFGQFMEAVRRNDIANVEQYLKFVDPGSNDNAAIREASDMGYTEMVGLLLSDDRVDPSSDNSWPIMVASEKGHTEVVRLLLSDHRVDPSDWNNFAIHWASYNGHIEIVRLLLSDPRVDPDAIRSKRMKQQLLNEERDRIISGYKSIEQSSPQIIIGEKQKSQIPKSLIKKIVYGATYQELCSIIPGKFPSVKLLALADLLKVKYDQNASYEELCGKVKLALLNLF